MARLMLSHSTSKALARVCFCLALGAVSATAQAQTKPLNDTGQTRCTDAAYNTGQPCSSENFGIGSNLVPRQDGRYGRDAAAAAGKLTKIGAGEAGFDFTKIANNGTVLPVSAALGGGPNDWACTRDNVTGLTWEVKTTSGLRSQYHGYAWYWEDASANGGNAGGVPPVPFFDPCRGTLNQCDTQNYVVTVNEAKLCGQSDWHLPSLNELLSIVHLGGVAFNGRGAIDNDFFPNTGPRGFWTNNTSASEPIAAWFVDFSRGASSISLKSSSGISIKLVRSGK